MRILVLGAGTIGLSWARLFATGGHDVVVCDPRPDLADAVAALPVPDADRARIAVVSDRRPAMAGVDLVQESGPERIAFKREVVADFADAAPGTALFFSSSSALLPSQMAADQPDAVAARIAIAHPFNPPHVMPLVELVPGARTAAGTIDAGLAFYRSLGREPVALHREVPGHVGNRLQKAMFQEALGLVAEGVIDAEGLDTLLKNSLGLRWASVGLFEGMALGGGAEGMEGLIDLLRESFAEIELHDPAWDEGLRPVFDQVDAAYGRPARPQLAARRDELQLGILRLRGQAD